MIVLSAKFSFDWYNFYQNRKKSFFIHFSFQREVGSRGTWSFDLSGRNDVFLNPWIVFLYEDPRDFSVSNDLRGVRAHLCQRTNWSEASSLSKSFKLLFAKSFIVYLNSLNFMLYSCREIYAVQTVKVSHLYDHSGWSWKAAKLREQLFGSLKPWIVFLY